LTIVAEKMDLEQSRCERGSRSPGQLALTEAENATFVIEGMHLGAGDSSTSFIPSIRSFTVFSSHFGGDEADDDLFVQQPDAVVVDGKVTIELQPNRAYTLSTIRTAAKGKTSPPALAQFPALYTDDFDNCTLCSIPKYLAPVAGAFDCVAAGGGRKGRSVKQASPAKSICNRGDSMPYAIFGDGFRTTYSVSVDVLLPADGSGGAFVGARVKGPVGKGADGVETGMDGVFFAINKTHWHSALRIADVENSKKWIAQGSLPPSANGTWRQISLKVSGTTATAAVDGSVVAPALAIPAPRNHSTGTVEGKAIDLGKGGYAAFGTVGYAIVEFDGLHVESS
jgi:hypothetical protein